MMGAIYCMTYLTYLTARVAAEDPAGAVAAVAGDARLVGAVPQVCAPVADAARGGHRRVHRARQAAGLLHRPAARHQGRQLRHHRHHADRHQGSRPP